MPQRTSHPSGPLCVRNQLPTLLHSTRVTTFTFQTASPDPTWCSHQPDFHASLLSRRGRCSRCRFQSPYRDRVSGLLQMAVSTVLRTNDIASRQPLPAEHCRYGTTDLSRVTLCLRGATRSP